MQWISTRDRLPEEDQLCWIYGIYNKGSIEKLVFSGYFRSKCICYNGSRLIYVIGWEYDTEMRSYALIDCISHWMPYFTPKPPEKK